MIEDQKYVIQQILEAVEREQPDGVILAGDIYDKPVPSVEAVQVFDYFLTELARRDTDIFMISGNHDSAERIAFGEEVLERGHVYVSPAYDGTLKEIVVHDEYGPVHMYLMPFLKPIHVKAFYPDAEITSYQDAVACVLENTPLNVKERNVLVAHQFLTNASRSESEEINVGGLDDIAAETFLNYDYVALGHIHGPQKVGSDKIRYSGSPIPYSFSEKNHKKGILVVELGAKAAGKEAELSISSIPLEPMHRWHEVKATFNEIMGEALIPVKQQEDYFHFILTDEEEIPNAMRQLQTKYPGTMKMSYDNTRTRKNQEIQITSKIEEVNDIELFEELFWLQNNQTLSEEQREYLMELLQECEE